MLGVKMIENLPLAIYFGGGIIPAVAIASSIKGNSAEDKRFSRMMLNIVWLGWIIVVPLWKLKGEKFFRNILSFSSQRRV